MDGTGNDDLTPPGPVADAETSQRTGGMSVDAWMAARAATTRTNPYAATPPPQPPPPSTDAGLGWTAFGLSVVFCFPLLPLVGLVLAIITLARRRFRPRWVAVVALLAGLAGTLGQVMLVTNDGFWEGFRDGMSESLEDEAEDARRSGERTEISSLKLRTGDCFDDPIVLGTRGEGAEVTSTVTLVPCDQAHDLEVFASIRIPGKDFPGQAAFDEYVADCFDAFRRYVGKPFGDSMLDVFYYSPTEQSWSLLGDRTITCLATDPIGKLKESVKGSRR